MKYVIIDQKNYEELICIRLWDFVDSYGRNSVISK